MKNSVKNTTAIDVETFSVPAFGNNVVEGMVALAEVIHNAYAAIITGTTMGLECIARIDISIKNVKDGKKLVVLNDGVHCDFQRLLNYGLHGVKGERSTVWNQYNTGFKTFIGFFNPSNDAWAFWTRIDGKVYRVCAPYSTRMTVEEMSEWPFAPWAVSAIEVLVKEEDKLDGITPENIGFYYSYAIQQDSLTIMFNGKKVKSVIPYGVIVSVPDKANDNEMKTFYGNGIPRIINGETVLFDYAVYELNENSPAPYSFNMEGTGVYLNVNNCFVRKLPVNSVIRKEGKQQGYLANHPSMNGLVAVINVHTPANHKADLPFVNAKDSINWKKKNGSAYLNAINELVGESFRYRVNQHKHQRIANLINGFCEKMFGMLDSWAFSYEKAISNEGLRADALIGTKFCDDEKKLIAPNDVHCIVEYKSGAVNMAAVMQAYGYYITLQEKSTEPHPIAILLLGTSLTKDAEVAMERLTRLEGVKIDFFNYEKI